MFTFCYRWIHSQTDLLTGTVVVAISGTKCHGIGRETCCGTPYTSQPWAQQHFTTDLIHFISFIYFWHAPLLDSHCSMQTYHCPNQSHEAFTPLLVSYYSLHLPTEDVQAELTSVAGCIPWWLTHLQMVTHPSANWARHRAATWKLPVSQPAVQLRVLWHKYYSHRIHWITFDVCWCLRSFIHFWHAPLWVHSAKHRHQSPEWTILSYANSFFQGEVQWFQVLLGSLHPHSMGASPVGLLQFSKGEAVAWHLIRLAFAECGRTGREAVLEQ